ncbi:unnamed protein product [Durusdinium trenchii]|uniref:Integrase catalytic domain-containing protein n=1 Tax=Durusdinium trenchii TaxID=1381693 RepID=A0ABP0KEB5_9DINO
MKNATGDWIEASNVIPKDAVEIYVQVRHTRRGEFQDMWEDFKSSHFSRKERQMLSTAMKKMPAAGKVLSEVFCPPRITKILRKRGYDVGTSFDLLTGWDLSKPEERKAMWKALREERPEVILACPPCKAFSRMQAVNWGRMDPKKRVHLFQTGRERLHLAIAVLRWQLRRGGAILFEHPDGATSWQEPELQSLAASRGVQTVVCDQCMFGLNVDGAGLNRNRTRWLSNMPPVLEALEVKCDKSHFHVPLENGRPLLAQVYPDGLCQAISNGILKYLNGTSTYAMEEDQDEDEEEAQDELDPVPDEGPGDYNPTEEEKKAVMRVHRAVGHPQDREFIRFLRAARVRGEIVQWAAKKFKCDVCESKRHPKAPRPTALPRAYQPNRVLGLDLFYVPAPGDGKQTVPVLNVLDWGTNYQMCEVLLGKNPNEVWEAYMSTWARTFGHPEVITCDAGREFLGEFIQKAAAEGIVIHQIASKAPWQQGKTERHGGLFKELLEKARSEVVIQSTKDLKQLMVEVEQAKNRYSNRSGFAPIQRQIGQWPRLPTSIMSDEAIDPTLLNGVITDDLEKLHHMRNIARKAFCEHNAKNTLKRALRARPRVWVDYKPGEYVFVFRVPRMKKRKHGGPVDDASLSTKARWVGPGVVIAPDGANLWVSMLGELWKVAREQCRPATNDEKMGIEAVVQECQELVEELKRGSHRLGYKDLTQEEFPPEEDGGEGDREQQGRQDQHPRFEEAVEEVEYTPTQVEGEHEEDPEEAGQVKRRRSINEPEQEEAPLSRANSEASRAEARHHPGFPGGVPETPPVNVDRPPIDPMSHEVQEALRQSELDANRLDGVPGPTSGPIYRWQQRARQDHIAPYFEDQEWFLAEAEEAMEEENQTRQTKIRQLAKTRAEKDEWSLDWKNGTLTRHHRRKRKAKFDPKLNSDAPLPWTFLTERRETHVRKAHEGMMEEDDWQTPQRKSLDEWWKGKTVFYLKEIKEAKNYVAEKKGQDEGRPDASGPSSLIASKLSKLTIEDILQLNQVVTELKAHSELSLKVQPLKKMRLSVVTDASFANAGFHSQGGHLVLAHENNLRDGAAVTTNVLAWRSGKLQRIVNSTLAAETQSLSRGLAELLWIMVMVQELTDGTFNIKAWRSRLEGEELLVMSSELSERGLQESLAVVDAKSLYDHLSKDCLGGQDKRTAIEIQIIRQDLKELGGQVKWVDHLAMPADGLTKVLGSNAALYELINSGRFSIRPTEELMKKRAEARSAGQSNADIRRFGIKENTGCCESMYPDMSTVDPESSMPIRLDVQGP